VTSVAVPGAEPASVAPGAEPASVAAARSGGLAEFMLVGGATLVLFPLAWLAPRVFGLDAAELAVGFTAFHAAHVVNDPHFSVTYLLFYRDAKARAFGDVFVGAQRLRYLAAGLFTPAVLLAWATLAIGSGSARGLGWLVELMFALVGWHYVKQGFGVLMVLSARRGVRYGAGERRVLLAHALAGWAFAWASPAVPGVEVEEKGIVYTALAHPGGFELVTGTVLAASTLGLVLMLAKKARREGSLPPLSPLVGFLVSVWLWSIFSSIDPLMVYVVPALHSLQYLYFVGLLERNRARAAEAAPHFGRPVRDQLLALAVGAILLGLLQFHALPSLLDAARLLVPHRSRATLVDLGSTPWFAALFAVVNIHHYAMDAVIWRRENPETRFLQE
jgi:hypothetical protein